MNTVKKEKIEELCIRYLDCLDPAQAAINAGLDGDPLVTGTRLLSTRSARRVLKRLTDTELVSTLALAGLIKLAVGRRQTGCMQDAQADDGICIDAFAITDAKRGKDGSGEVKLVNRLEALKMLFEVCNNDTSRQSVKSFFDAMGNLTSDADE